MQQTNKLSESGQQYYTILLRVVSYTNRAYSGMYRHLTGTVTVMRLDRKVRDSAISVIPGAPQDTLQTQRSKGPAPNQGLTIHSLW